LEERDPFAARREADVELRLRALAHGEGIARGQRQRLLEAAKQIAARLGVHANFAVLQDFSRAGYLLAAAYPDPLAQRRPGREPRYRMAGGRGAMLTDFDPLASSEWLAVASVSGEGRDAHIHLAAPLHGDDIARLQAQAGENIEVRFDAQARAVIARRVRK